MGVCDAVVELAVAVEHALSPAEPRHRLLIGILKMAPLYREIRDLSAWETSFQSVLTEDNDHSQIGELLWEIFEFGRFNLYGGFDARGSKLAYEGVISMLARNGVQASANHNVGSW